MTKTRGKYPVYTFMAFPNLLIGAGRAWQNWLDTRGHTDILEANFYDAMEKYAGEFFDKDDLAAVTKAIIKLMGSFHDKPRRGSSLPKREEDAA